MPRAMSVSQYDSTNGTCSSPATTGWDVASPAARGLGEGDPARKHDRCGDQQRQLWNPRPANTPA